jgi:predicted DNA-binding transcriptional regulator YafY
MLNQYKILRVFQLIAILKSNPPKSIKFLSGLLNTTDRTVYRYLDLVKEIGFNLERDDHNRFFIRDDYHYEIQAFTNDEALLLKELLLSSASSSKLRDAILQKIYINSEIEINSNHILKAYLGKMIALLSSAISSNKRVILKNYHSLNSNKINDRIVEPITFTDNFNCLIAFEITSQTNKYFSVERISNVEILDEPQKCKVYHQFDPPDVFGFSKLNGEPLEIILRLTLRGYLILKEEYPLTAPYIKKEKNKNTYLFHCKINNFKPLNRFILGLQDDIEVIMKNYL